MLDAQNTKNIYADNADFCLVSPICHFTESPCKLFFFLTEPVQLKDSEILNLN